MRHKVFFFSTYIQNNLYEGSFLSYLSFRVLVSNFINLLKVLPAFLIYNVHFEL